MTVYEIQVHTYSGYKANEKPRTFMFRGKKHVVSEIVHQTYEEVHGRGFCRKYIIKTDEGHIFVLSYDEGRDQWFLEE